MVANLFLLLTSAVLISAGVYLLLERAMTKMLMGLLLMGNGTNLLILTAGGGAGAPPIQGRDSAVVAQDADPLSQAMILTAIVISMAMTAFILALAFRQYRYRTADFLQDDTEDTAVAKRPPTAIAAPDHDASDDPATGRPTSSGDTFGPRSFEQPVQEGNSDD
ncbi:Na(+)/H(+) antiporter subunit C [Corynebacterium epidermidicanis]|uniref:Multisubunit sodium/proton antiporter, MrpC subunit n=1 Tax=Corynebacterium epidermidicanis TaxID=1050174 RepID=A0A0G3GS37_9CORY|nr:Na(+)/H(+) antiporter subunit C [Corynebacterium epidermidicanis]AKK04011.1 multisubunit sodium/proton antiporter, MrpC subunit [Corynebacterium epidermidicanis]